VYRRCYLRNIDDARYPAADTDPCTSQKCLQTGILCQDWLIAGLKSAVFPAPGNECPSPPLFARVEWACKPYSFWRSGHESHQMAPSSDDTAAAGISTGSARLEQGSRQLVLSANHWLAQRGLHSTGLQAGWNTRMIGQPARHPDPSSGSAPGWHGNTTLKHRTSWQVRQCDRSYDCLRPRPARGRCPSDEWQRSGS